MGTFSWQCPHCETTLSCLVEKKQQLRRCPDCNGVSRPTECARPHDVNGLRRAVRDVEFCELPAREIRQMLREFRIKIKHLFDPELKQLLGALTSLERSGVEADVERFVSMLADAVEIEMEDRIHESAWLKTKRGAFRGATATRDWLRTEQGSAVGAGIAILAAFLGIQILRDD